MTQTLYEFAGGAPAMLALVTAHHARCLADPELNHPFSHDDANPEHIARLAAYWGEVLGGPLAFTGELGDQESVLTMHTGNGDMGDLGERFYVCFVGAMDDAGLPDARAFRDAMAAYMRWAVNDVLSYAEPEDVSAGVRIPHWAWDGLQAPPA
jgi:hemoglobin